MMMMMVLSDQVPLQIRYFNTPLVDWTHDAARYRRINMKALARYQIILLGEQRHIGVNNLPKVVARQCSGQESNTQPADRESSVLTTTPPGHLSPRPQSESLQCSVMPSSCRGRGLLPQASDVWASQLMAHILLLN